MYSPKVALFPGSFDPFTKGHEDVVLRALSLFDKVVIGIGVNASKSRYFEAELMSEKVKETFSHIDRVEVAIFKGLTARFAQKIGAGFILRGVRNTTDFEYENTIAQANKHLVNGLETVFLITSPHLSFISSTIVRDLHRHQADVSAFLPFKI
jgi:pantetheine-phosphate adenylyltransferase